MNPSTRRPAVALVPRPGMTLIEMLIAMTLTLIMMGAVAQIFGMLGEGVSNSRNTTELTERMRAVAYRLRQDLAGVSADMSAIGRPELASGYFELIEGPNTDELLFSDSTVVLEKSRRDGDPMVTAYIAATGSDDRLLGDTDDLLAFTTRSDTSDFRGKLGPVGIRSQYAEVIWYCTPTPNSFNPVTFTLHRRQRLVKSHPGAGDFSNGNRRPFLSWAELHGYTDVSCRVEGGFAHPNSLGDLTKRENRFLHAPVFPHAFDFTALAATLEGEEGGARFGDDAILTNVIAFDVRVYDPGAPVQVPTAAVTVSPGDPGYQRPTGTPPFSYTPAPSVMTGAYVDLGYGIDPADGVVRPPHLGGGASTPLFFGAGDLRSGLPGSLATPRIFCTWSSHYETDGLDQDQILGPDQGTNGFDDNDNDMIDEAAEAETASPYPLELDGIEVRIRCYEPASRRVKQITVRQSFTGL